MPAASPEPGQLLLHYRLLDEIGQGGMGRVFRAEDQKLRRVVAVKVLHAQKADETDRKRLVREARSASALNHAGVVTIFALETAGDLDFIVMEYFAGDSLRTLIDRRPLEPKLVIDLGAQLADALDSAHCAGILHRDIKPSNILMTAGRAKLVDFGIARPFDGERARGAAPASDTGTVTSDITREGAVIGTVSYMSPEQVRGDVLDARSDVFSLGATLYEAATGKRPFTGETQVWIGHAILHVDPPPPSSLRPDLPAAFDAIVVKALAKRKEARYASARELADELSALGAAFEVGGSTDGDPAREPRQTWWSRRAAAAVALLALSSGIAYWFGRGGSSPAHIEAAPTAPASVARSAEPPPLASIAPPANAPAEQPKASTAAPEAASPAVTHEARPPRESRPHAAPPKTAPSDPAGYGIY